MKLSDLFSPEVLGLVASSEIAPWFVAGFLIGILLTAFTAISVKQFRSNPNPGGFYANDTSEF